MKSHCQTARGLTYCEGLAKLVHCERVQKLPQGTAHENAIKLANEREGNTNTTTAGAQQAQFARKKEVKKSGAHTIEAPKGSGKRQRVVESAKARRNTVFSSHIYHYERMLEKSSDFQTALISR